MTPQQIEALKLALEALIAATPVKAKDPHMQAVAITAIKEALAEHAMSEVQRLGQEIEQEPVAWPCLIDSADFSENTITLAMQCEDYKVSAGTHWLSITPPQRTWVGLTDEQANEYNYLGPDMPWVVREVEAILKERNQ
jgi:hypothetical protein